MDTLIAWAPTLLFGATTFGIIASFPMVSGNWFWVGPPVGLDNTGKSVLAAGAYNAQGYSLKVRMMIWAWIAFNTTQEQVGIPQLQGDAPPDGFPGYTGPMWAHYRWGGPNTAGAGYGPPVPEGKGYDKRYGPHFGLYVLAAWALSLFVWML